MKKIWKKIKKFWEELKILFDTVFPSHSLIHIGVIFLFLILSICGLLWHVETLSWISIFLIDLHLITILFVAAIKSDKIIKKKWVNNILPTKTSSLIIFALLFFTTISGFAGVFFQSGLCNLHKPFDAVYLSFSILTTIGDCPSENTYLKILTMWEVGTGLLLFAGAFGLLISKISDYKI